MVTKRINFKKKKECKRGFECGFSCIARIRVCRSNIGNDGKKIIESYSQYLDRITQSNTSNNDSQIDLERVARRSSRPPIDFTGFDEEGRNINLDRAIKDDIVEEIRQTNEGKELDNTATLQGKEFNPNSISDLSFERFEAEYLPYKRYKEGLERGLSEARERFDSKMSEEGLSKSDRKRAVTEAIRDGLNLSDQEIGDVSLNKTIKALNQKNSEPDKELSRLKSIAQPILNAIEYPLVSEEEGRGHKPTMTREEAREYTKGSYTGNLSFYHGNPVPITRSIAQDGADPEFNDDGLYGKGTYFAAARSASEIYMTSGILFDESSGQYIATKAAEGKSGQTSKLGGEADKDVGMLEINAKFKNPMVVNSSTIDDLIPGNGENLNEFARAKGYDGIIVADLGYLVTFDTKQVVVVGNEEYKASDSELIKTIERHRSSRDDRRFTGKNRLKSKEGYDFRTSLDFERRVMRFTPTGKIIKDIEESDI